MGYREEFFKSNPGVKIPGKRGTYWRCVSCGNMFSKSEIDVDHRIPKRDGGVDALWNLQPMCKHCNRSKRDNQTGFETAQSIVGAAMNGGLSELASSVATQKVKDFLGIKYKR